MPRSFGRQVQLFICNYKDLCSFPALIPQLGKERVGRAGDIHTTHIFFGTDSSIGPAAAAGNAAGDPLLCAGKGPVGHSTARSAVPTLQETFLLQPPSPLLTVILVPRCIHCATGWTLLAERCTYWAPT